MLYRLTQVLNQDELLEFLRLNPNTKMTIEAVEEAFEEASSHSAPEPAPKEHAPHAPRRSKVNAAIIATLQHGPAMVPALKAGLEKAGMSASSLPSGLAVLQKSGMIQRLEDGSYELREAAQ